MASWREQQQAVLQAWRGKAWTPEDEAKHPRDHGEFAKKEGGDANDSGGGGEGGEKEATPKDKLRLAFTAHQAAREQLRQARRDVLQHLSEQSQQKLVEYGKHKDKIVDLNDHIDSGEEGSEQEAAYNELDEAAIELHHVETPKEHFDTLTEIIDLARDFRDVADGDGKAAARQIIASAKQAKDVLRDYASLRGEMAAIKRNEWPSDEEISQQKSGGMVHTKAFLAARQQKSWEESKHPRGHEGNPGQFSRASGSAAASADQPTKRPEPEPSPDQPTNRTSGDAALAERRESSHAKPPSAASKSPLHASMEQAPVRHADNLKAGVNEAILLTLQDGTQAVFKPQSGETKDPRAGRAGVPPGTQFRREIAASRIADILGFGDLVPATTIRDQGGDIGSVQAYVGDAVDAVDSIDPFDGSVDAARAAAFDYLIGHLDRHKGNWLKKDGKLVLIDNGLSFPTKYHERDFFNMEFWRNAKSDGLPVPDLSSMKPKWEEVERELASVGLEKEAIVSVKTRFEALTSGQYKKVAELPSLLDAGQDLKHMASYYDRDERRNREI